jgi:hypothetical protein
LSLEFPIPADLEGHCSNGDHLTRLKECQVNTGEASQLGTSLARKLDC